MKRLKRIFLCFLLLFPLLALAKGKSVVWVIDAGHGGHDAGCVGSKAKEKDINLKVALRVAELVRANIPGVKVVMTRDTDRFLSLEQRCIVANEAGASLFLSIHVNSAPEVSNVRGTETYYGPIGATTLPDVEAARKQYQQRSELLAWEMQKYYGLAGRPISRGVKRERYFVILHTKMPSILTEIGFISTPSEQEYMISKAGQEEIAQCIYRGLRDYKQTIESGNEKNVLAEMRSTGGRAPGSVPAGKADAGAYLAQNNEVTDPDVTTAASDKAGKTSGKGGTMAASVTTGRTSGKTTGKETASGGKGQTTNAKTPAKNGKDQTSTTTRGNASASSGKGNANVTLDPALEPELDSEELSFSIQILSTKVALKTNDRAFKGMKDIRGIETDGKYKYVYGRTSDYAAARKMLLEVRQIFPDAFLVAFLGTRQISTSDALELYVKKK